MPANSGMGVAQGAKIGVIGGSGLYQLEGLENLTRMAVDTPFGAPSDEITCGELLGSEFLFLPRHGKYHQFLPSNINYRANIYALKTLGAKWIISISAAGSLSEDLKPGDFFVPDQIVDRTINRQKTFFSDGIVAHVAFAEPYCPVLREAVFESAREVGGKLNFKALRDGIYVCMEGPAFSTKAECQIHRDWGAKAIGMTNMPEAVLAREAEIAYSSLLLITDYDCWHESEALDITNILEVIRRGNQQAKQVLAHLAPRLSKLEPSAMASQALKNAILTDLKSVPKEKLENLKAILAPYL